MPYEQEPTLSLCSYTYERILCLSFRASEVYIILYKEPTRCNFGSIVY